MFKMHYELFAPIEKMYDNALKEVKETILNTDKGRIYYPVYYFKNGEYKIYLFMFDIYNNDEGIKICEYRYFQ